MFKKVELLRHLLRNMGWRYVAFRLFYELKRKSGWLFWQFPVQPKYRQYLTLDDWKQQRPAFFLDNQPAMPYTDLALPVLDLPECLQGTFCFFSGRKFALGTDYNWLTNPQNGFTYNAHIHWSKVNDFSPESGDIKFVWEKSRFTYLYDVIRYDQQNGTDHAEWVLSEIQSWIAANKVNAGPNYKCSQEISLRLLNWIFALHFYRHSPHLTKSVFNHIQYALYWQIKHVYDNIHFSRIAVRNNHAITETLALYIVGSLFPQIPGASKWKSRGKKWFEQEILYQVYDDGTFLQFSMNYHRVVVQLLTWAFAVSHQLNERFTDQVYERAYKSLQFLATCQDDTTGWLPNYGSNDGALFFPWSSSHYRDYRPQLNALHQMLTGMPLYKAGPWQEDWWWFRTSQPVYRPMPPVSVELGWHQFGRGGYAVLREAETLTFIRCGQHKDRPAQADNLHMDVWHKGKNILLDAGSYQYNTAAGYRDYFMGTLSHNTVMLGNQHQMLKGDRFIWYHWSQALEMQTHETADAWIFEGRIRAFGHLGDNIMHSRLIKKWKFATKWEIEDYLENKPDNLPLVQLWHPADALLRITPTATNAEVLPLQKEQGWVSHYYGEKTELAYYWVSSQSNELKTTIEL